MKYPEIYQYMNTYTPIPEEEWLYLESITHERKVPKGEIILKAGDPATTFCFIKEGFMRMYYIDKAGNEFTKTFRDKFDIASPYAEMLQGINSRIYIQALEDSVIVTLKYQEFIDLFQRNVCWNNIGRKFAEKFFVVKERREWELLTLDAKERYEIFLEEYPGYSQKIPQFHIASYLGITPVSLSRIVKQLKN